MEEAIWLTARGRYQEGRGGSLFLFWFSSSSAVVWRGLAHRFISFRSCKAHNTHNVQLHLILSSFFLLFFFSFFFLGGGGTGEGGQLLGFKTRIWTCNGTQVGKPMQYECLHACFFTKYIKYVLEYTYICLGEWKFFYFFMRVYIYGLWMWKHYDRIILCGPVSMI